MVRELTQRLEDITHVTSERNYVRVHLKDGSHSRVRGVMDHWQDLLAATCFVRVGRGVIVNLSALQGVERVGRDLSLVTMNGGHRAIRLGRKATVRLSQLLARERGSGPAPHDEPERHVSGVTARE